MTMAEKAVPRKTFSFGSCNYDRTSPPREKLSLDTKAVNVLVPFEDALKLNLAIDECVRALNRYKRSTTAGKKMALNVTIYFDIGRITVSEVRL